MTLIALCSASGAPGVTCSALALASQWPGPGRPIVVEADPKGGDLALRFGLAQKPGLLAWAAAARRGDIPSPLSHVQRLPGGPRVLLAPPGHEQTRAALELLVCHPGARELWTAGEFGGQLVLLADVGRLGAEQDVQAMLLGAADTVLLVCRPEMEAIAHVEARQEALCELVGDRLRTLVIGSRPYRKAEIDAALQSDCLVLPHSPAETLGLLGEPSARWLPMRRRLRTAARRLAEQLSAEIAVRGGAVPANAGGEHG